MDKLTIDKFFDYKRIRDFFYDKDNFKLGIKIFLITFFVGILAYNLLIIYGYTNPDGIMEGLTYYNNAHFALTVNGRWAIRYIEEFFGGIVNPMLDVFFYALCISICVLMMKKLFPMISNLSLYLSGAILIVNPIIISHMSFLYISIAYALATLMAFLFVYANHEWRYIGFILGSLALSISIGLFQSYIGVAALLALLTIIYRLINNKHSILSSFILGIKYLLSSFLGVFLYYFFLNQELKKYDAQIVGDRMSAFSIENIFSNISITIPKAYERFFNLFNDKMLNRNIYFMILLIISILSLIYLFYKLIKDKKYFNLIFVLLFIPLIPLLGNIIQVIYPTYDIYYVMMFQVLLVIPFILVLVDLIDKYQLVFKILSSISILMLIWTYLLSSNATFRAYQLSYQYLNNQYEMILDDIYHTEGYQKDNTPIIIAGFIQDDFIRNNNPLYQYAIGLTDNVAFWEDMNGVIYNRYNYFYNYFGIDPGYVGEDVYLYYVNSDEFKAMPVWPEKGSIQIFNNTAIVKLTNEPLK